MQVTCPVCKRVIDAEDINLDRMVAKCRGCNSVFDVSAQIGGGGAQAGPVRRRPKVPMPAGITVNEENSELFGGAYREGATPRGFALVRRWYSSNLYQLAFFCLVWDAFLFFWYTHLHGAPWLFYVFPLAHLAIGVSLTYRTLCGFVNRTHITANGNTFRLWHTPLPWPGRRELPANQIAQIYCKQRRKRSNNNGPSIQYGVFAELKNGKRVNLLGGLPDPEQALFVEQCIEEHLGIVDVAVAGELAV